MKLKKDKEYIYTGDDIILINTNEAVAIGTGADRELLYKSAFPTDENGELVWESPNDKIFQNLCYPFQTNTKFKVINLTDNFLKIKILEHKYNFCPDETATIVIENFSDDILKNIQEII